jgi:HK97 family phage portal protein
MKGISYSPNITGRPNFYEWNVDRAISEGYKASTWVYTAVNKLSRAAASVEWICYKINADGSRGDRWPDHPFEIMMHEPNPFTNGQDWRERTYQHLWLAGNSISRIVSVGKVPIGLVQMMPNSVRPVPDLATFLSRYDLYENWAGAKTGELQPNEVLHLMFADPANMYWGISPLQAVAKTVDTDTEAVRWNKVSLQNRAVSDGVFSVSVPITKEEWEELREEIRDQKQGANNAHNPWILGYGTQWNPMSLTPIEMDFLESRKNNRTEILAVYGVPPPMAGIYDQATYDNVASARLIWWLDTIIPFLDDVKVALQFDLARRFGNNFVIDYDLSQVEALKVLQIQKISAARDLWSMGVPLQVINNVLDLGLPNDIAGTDVGYLPMTMYPVSSGKSQTAAKSHFDSLLAENSNLPLPKSEIPPSFDAHNKVRAEQKRFYPRTVYGEFETVEQRKEYYKAYDRTRIPWERKLQSLAEDQYLDDIDIIAKAFEQDGPTGVMNENLTLRVKWKDLLYHFSVNLVDTVGTDFYNQLTGNKSKAKRQNVLISKNGHTSRKHADLTVVEKIALITKQDDDYDEDFTWQDESILGNLENWAIQRSGQIVDTTLNGIMNHIESRSADGYTIPQIAKEIRSMADLSTYRSTLISRTEVVGYHNYAHNEAARQSNVVDLKTWISSGDDRVRESHANADGQSVPIDQTFTVGSSELEFPGDPNGDGLETIQCRCAVAYSKGEAGENFTPQTVTVQGYGDVSKLVGSSDKVRKYVDDYADTKIKIQAKRDVKRYSKELEKYIGVKINAGEIEVDNELSAAAATYKISHNIVINADEMTIEKYWGKDGYDKILVHELVHARGEKGLDYSGPDDVVPPAVGFEEGIAETIATNFSLAMEWDAQESPAYDAYVSTYAEIANIADIDYDGFMKQVAQADRDKIPDGIVSALNAGRIANGKDPYTIDDEAKDEFMHILADNGFGMKFQDNTQYDGRKLHNAVSDFLIDHGGDVPE